MLTSYNINSTKPGDSLSRRAVGSRELLQPGFGRDEEAHEKFVRLEDKGDGTGGVWLPRGSWIQHGQGVVISTAFAPDECVRTLASYYC
jgi:hypothetical protein